MRSGKERNTMLGTCSRITTDDSGWTWLEPEHRSLTLRHGIVSLVLSVLLIAAAAAATIPPPVLAVPAFAAVVGAGGLIARAAWRESHTRLGVARLGLLIQRGTRQDQVGWPAVAAVAGERRRRRIAISIATRSDVIVAPATFSAEPALRWLQRCTEHAAVRRLDPRPVPGGCGFVAGDAVTGDA